MSTSAWLSPNLDVHETGTAILSKSDLAKFELGTQVLSLNLAPLSSNLPKFELKFELSTCSGNRPQSSLSKSPWQPLEATLRTYLELDKINVGPENATLP